MVPLTELASCHVQRASPNDTASNINIWTAPDVNVARDYWQMAFPVL